MASISVYPASYDKTDYSYASVVSNYPLTNPIGKPSTGTSMCRINLKTGSRAESWVYYNFDLSAIPRNVTIDFVSCQVKTYVNQTNANRISTRTVQLYSGNTAKGSAGTMSTSTTAQSLTCGTWTREELDNCRLKLYCVRGTNNTTTTYYMGLYGATLTVTYTVVEDKETNQYMIKTNGSWNALNTRKVYKKINGTWVEQTDFKTVFDTNTNYVKG